MHRGCEYNRGTQCGKTARWGLCGGRRVTGVPTAEISQIAPGPPLDVIRQSRIIRLRYSFIETKLFTRLADDLLSDDELRELQSALIDNPEAGDVVPGSGGVRKLRWRAPGRGKRSGYRVIYFTKLAQGIIWMLTIYPKNVAENIPAHILRQIRKEVDDA